MKFSWTYSVISLALAVTLCQSASPLDGYSVGSVILDNGGRIYFQKDLTWAWQSPGHPTQHFKLVGRDKWSAYLCSTHRSGFQVDLYEDVAIFKSRTQPWHSFKIKSADFGIINGRNIGEATFDGGKVQQVGVDKWVLNTTGIDTAYEWTEAHRDEWSVYLLSPATRVSPRIAMQIDYHQKVISLKVKDQVFAQFKITGADYSTHYDYRPDSFTC